MSPLMAKKGAYGALSTAFHNIDAMKSDDPYVEVVLWKLFEMMGDARAEIEKEQSQPRPVLVGFGIERVFA